MRRFLISLGALLLGLGLWFFWTRSAAPNSALTNSQRSTSTVAPPATVPPSTNTPAATTARIKTADTGPVAPTEARIALADDLNAPGGDIHRDLLILQDIFIAWRTNYPHDGNPVGENNEITAALTGGNSLQLALIPPNHPAINANGELCDRWGTPFVFHQLSGTRMEIRSAGPDRKLYTPDDAVLTP